MYIPTSPKRAASYAAAFILLAMVSHAVTPPLRAQAEATAKENDPLTTYLGKNRVVLVFAPTEGDPKLVKQLAELNDKAGLNERDLIVLPVLADDKAAGKSLPYLQTKFNGGKSTFSLVLVGKDGNDAYQSSDPVEAKTLYARIDACRCARRRSRKRKPSPTTRVAGVRPPPRTTTDFSPRSETFFTIADSPKALYVQRFPS